jgi:rod shape-determining protein MreC
MICSKDVKFGGMVQSDPEVVGIIKGQTPTRLVLDIIDNGKVEPGDPVVTSGYSDRIPRGITIGIVAEVVFDPSLGTRRVFVAPAARIGSALEVTVIK